MDTNDLINALAADARPSRRSLPAIWWGAAACAIAIAAIVFFVMAGPRPDFAAAAETARFQFKFVVSFALAISAFGAARALSRPGEGWRDTIAWLAVAPLLLVLAAVAELRALPSDVWSASAMGANASACLAYIFLIGLGPLAVFIAALRQGAPTRPGFAGAVAGLLAGGIAAAIYAAHCTDDSPLFVAVWYTAAVLGLALVGSIAGRFLVRW